jgi:hypothetical protein
MLDLGGEAMDPRAFSILVGIIFALVALLHLARIIMGWPILISDWSVPMWVSWIGFIVAGGLAFFALSLGVRNESLERSRLTVH